MHPLRRRAADVQGLVHLAATDLGQNWYVRLRGGSIALLDTDDTLNDDDLLGTKEKKKVGESWPVTPENIPRDSERVNVMVKPEDVEGSFRLDGLQKVGDTEGLKLSGNLKV